MSEHTSGHSIACGALFALLALGVTGCNAMQSSSDFGGLWYGQCWDDPYARYFAMLDNNRIADSRSRTMREINLRSASALPPRSSASSSSGRSGRGSH